MRASSLLCAVAAWSTARVATAAITCESDTLVALGPDASGGFINVSQATYAGGPIQFASSIGVTEVVATKTAFCAILTTGVATAWGDNANGGNAGGGVSDAESIYANDHACVVHKTDGTIVAWGDASKGGDLTGSGITASSTVMRSVFPIAGKSFVGIAEDGTAIYWGDQTTESDPSAYVPFPAAALFNKTIVKVVGRSQSIPMMGALTDDGVVHMWGHGFSGGNTSDVVFASSAVDLVATGGAAAAILDDGSVVCWGATANNAGDCSGVTFPGPVAKIYATNSAMAAVTTEGSVVCWGASATVTSFTQSSVASANVTKIVANHGAFAALTTLGYVPSWGSSSFGGDGFGATWVGPYVDVVANGVGFAALGATGLISAWGDSSTGHTQLTAANVTGPVLSIVSLNEGFVAPRTAGGLALWGSASLGEAGWDGETCGVEVLAANDEVVFAKLVAKPSTRAPTAAPSAGPSAAPTKQPSQAPLASPTMPPQDDDDDDGPTDPPTPLNSAARLLGAGYALLAMVSAARVRDFS